MRVLITIFTLSMLLSGCRRAVCDTGATFENPRQPGPFWSAHQDLFVPGTVVCGSRTDRSSKIESVYLDFDPEPEVPMATLVEFLESKGWQRREQKHNDMTFEVAFVKDDARLSVAGFTSHKRTELDYDWSIRKEQ